MLAALSPLIQSELAGHAVYPDGIRWCWWAQDGQAGVGDQAYFSVTMAEREDLATLPIAILVSNFTASSGEACVISFLGDERVRVFGIRTKGLATINQPFELKCGGVLMVTTAYFADRTGRIWPNGIQPDQVIVNSDDAILQAAEWLSEVSQDSSSSI